MLDKPKYGAPCNSCGRCCVDQLCPLGGAFFHLPLQVGNCPALQPHGERRVCGLVANPEAYALAATLLNGKEAMSAAAAHLIGAGHGCDASYDESERDPEVLASFRRKHQSKGPTRKAAALWGIKHLVR
jgi:hypothetical protein